MKADGPAVGGSALGEDWLEDGLRKVHVVTGTGGVVVGATFGIVTPAVDAGVFVAGHAVAPACVLHVFTRCGLGQACLLEVDVT